MTTQAKATVDESNNADRLVPRWSSTRKGPASPSHASQSPGTPILDSRLREYIARLARHVEHRWGATHYDSRSFPIIATDALNEHPAHRNIAPVELLQWAATAEPLPPQDGMDNRFGEPSIRLFDNGRFFIQALFWFDSTTSIHQHSFSGAFEVLAGSSIHSRYDFDVTERLNEHLQLGTLRLTGVELLQRGAVRAIHNGSQFVHSLFHLEHPSVSFLVRTHNDVESGPLYTYFKPGVAFNSFHVTPRIRMTREVLIAANRLGSDAFERLAREAIENVDAETAFHALVTCRQLTSFPDWPALPPSLENLVAARSANWCGTIGAALVEQARQERIVDSRKHVTDPELRFCLALLLNVPSRRGVFELIAAQFSNRNPIELVVQWVRRLWNTPMTTEEGVQTNLLLLECEQNVKEPALAVLARLLEGQNAEQIAESMPNLRGVAEVCALWEDHPFLQPLFRTDA